MTEMDKLDDQLCKSFEALNNIINSLGVPNHLFANKVSITIPKMDIPQSEKEQWTIKKKRKKIWRNISEPWEASNQEN